MGHEIERDAFLFFREVVYRHSGIRLTDKEAGMLGGRVWKRTRALGLESVGEYVAYLRGPAGEQEIRALLDLVTVNYTFFFRDSGQFQTLSARVLPEILADAEGSRSRTIRGWSAGCSSGEEPYSIAVCFAEAVGDPDRHDFRILATDINRKALRTAARGVYPLERLAGFPREHFHKYLTRDAKTPEGCLRLSEEIRRMVVFRRFNILRDASPLRDQLDFIFCRNVMIYFDEETRARLVRNFYRYLAPGGHLFIGEPEKLEDPERRFRRVGTSIFRKP